MNIRAVIGKNYGDEGKGLAVDLFAGQAQSAGLSCLVVRHNGGAQAGHTVETPGGRFVFHQLSSGSFRDADTMWSETYLPDLYKLGEEIRDFRLVYARTPRIYASGACRCVTIDDVLLNMAVETSRGSRRHGSCGMGINEAVQRSKREPFRLTFGQAAGGGGEAVYRAMRRSRLEYVPDRLKELGFSKMPGGEYGELLKENAVLRNAAEEMSRAAELVTAAPCRTAADYDEVIFEGAQGLLLDEKAPGDPRYLTPSETGLANPVRFCRQYLGGQLPEAVYVTRSYVTRHGAGPLPYEAPHLAEEYGMRDETNRPNEWQGTLRFALHGMPEEFAEPIRRDLERAGGELPAALLVTHLDETRGMMLTKEGCVPAETWCARPGIRGVFGRVLLSFSRINEPSLIRSVEIPQGTNCSSVDDECTM